MPRSVLRIVVGAVVVIVVALAVQGRADAVGKPSPAGTANQRTAVLAGGCFWGIEAVFEHLRGVTDVVSGYSGGTVKDPSYERVGAGETGHAEAVRITYDADQVSYADLLRVFFSVAHDPTQLNRQGPDLGTQYRSAIFAVDDEQAGTARAYIAKLTSDKVFRRPIVTQVVRLAAFYPAEAYHQDYMKHHPMEPYIVIHDRPKVELLRKLFPDWYRER